MQALVHASQTVVALSMTWNSSAENALLVPHSIAGDNIISFSRNWTTRIKARSMDALG